MAFKKKLEFGNYTLKFGDEKVLLDLFEEVVMPSFHEMKYIRSLKDKGDYFFLDTKLITLDENSENPILGISGRIVKNTMLSREQVFTLETGLIDSKKALETAPSSTFLLIINTHRLILCKEVPGAPTIKNFQATSQFCLKKQYENFIKKLVSLEKVKKKKNSEIERKTKKSIIATNPHPSLRITPLSDSQTLKDFVERLRHIDRVSIKLLPTNDEEINNDEFWADFGRRRETTNSKAAKVVFSNPKDGLDSTSIYEQANSASNLGNSEVKFKGYDQHGDSISGTNEDFSLTIDIDDLIHPMNIGHLEKGVFSTP